MSTELQLSSLSGPTLQNQMPLALCLCLVTPSLCVHLFLSPVRWALPCLADVLQEDLDRAQEEMVTLRSLLDSEKQSKADLRHTWEMANLQVSVCTGVHAYAHVYVV